MKFKVLVVSLLAFFAFVGSASARPPKIYEGEAESDAARFLHQEYAAWRYRSKGYLSCSHGRINRYTWTCRAGWLKGEICTEGRLRIVNEEAFEGTIYYTEYWRGRPC